MYEGITIEEFRELEIEQRWEAFNFLNFEDRCKAMAEQVPAVISHRACKPSEIHISQTDKLKFDKILEKARMMK